jgi:hypothetical protein
MSTSRATSPTRTASGRTSDLERLWRALLLTGWRCLVVIPANPATSSESVVGALRSIVPSGGLPDLEVIDGRGASMGDGDRLAGQVTERNASGRRVIAFIDPITQSLAGVPLVRAADAVLLVVQVESPDVDSLSSTLSIVGIDRVVGSVAVPATS